MKRLIQTLVMTVLLAIPVVVAISSNQSALAEDCTKIASPIEAGQTCITNTDSGGPIATYLRSAVKFFSGIVGLTIVLMVIVGGFQYMTSAGNPQGIEKAKKRFANAALGLVMFILLYGIMNYLIPGGVFG